MGSPDLFEEIKKSLKKRYYVEPENVVRCSWRLKDDSMWPNTIEMHVVVEVVALTPASLYQIRLMGGDPRGTCYEGSHHRVLFDAVLPMKREDTIYGYESDIYRALCKREGG